MGNPVPCPCGRWGGLPTHRSDFAPHGNGHLTLNARQREGGGGRGWATAVGCAADVWQGGGGKGQGEVPWPAEGTRRGTARTWNGVAGGGAARAVSRWAGRPASSSELLPNIPPSEAPGTGSRAMTVSWAPAVGLGGAGGAGGTGCWPRRSHGGGRSWLGGAGSPATAKGRGETGPPPAGPGPTDSPTTGCISSEKVRGRRAPGAIPASALATATCAASGRTVARLSSCRVVASPAVPVAPPSRDSVRGAPKAAPPAPGNLPRRLLPPPPPPPPAPAPSSGVPSPA